MCIRLPKKKNIMFRKAKSPLGNLLEANPNTPLKTVLTNSDLSTALRNENHALFKYFFPESKDRRVLNELIDWALTNKNNTSDDDFIYNRNATNVLTSTSKKFHQKLYEDGALSDKLKSFIDDKDYNESPAFSGQFSSILLQHSRQTNYQFFKDNPNFLKKILNHIHLLSYQRTIIELCSENLAAITNSQPDKLINDLGVYASNTYDKNEETSHGVFSVIDSIISESSEDVIKCFTTNEPFLTKLVDAALKLKKKYVLVDAFRTLDNLFKTVDPKIKNRIVDKRDIDFKSLKRNDIFKAFAYYPIFWKKGIEVMTDYFFQDVDKETNLIPNSSFCRSYVNVFKEMPFPDRIYYIEKLRLQDKIFPFINKVEYNGCIYKLTKALSRPPKKDESTSLLSPDEKNILNSENWVILVFKFKEYYDDFKIKKKEMLGYEKRKSDF